MRNNGLQSQQNTASAITGTAGARSSAVFGEIEITDDVIQEFTPIFFEIIDSIFTPHAPKATVKIGLIYLARIMDLYSDFTSKYLKILLTCPENVRSSTLDLEPVLARVAR